MHMSDALLSPAVGGTMYALSTAAGAYSVAKIRKNEAEIKAPVMGVMGAFVFATQMINFTIPGTGSSGHLCGGMLLSAILGPEAGFITMIGVLLIQCLLFADGGILALGANVWNMAFYGCFLGGMVIWRYIMKNGMNKKKIALASIVGSILSLQLGAFSVVLQTLLSGVTELPFSVFVGLMQPIHLAIGLGEGLITTAVLCFIYETRPELLDSYKESGKESKLSYKGIIGVLATVAVVIGGFLSLFASSFPDGLEWSIAKVVGETELEATGSIYESLDKVQASTAFFPDYAFKGSESAVGASFVGVIGTVLVLAVCVLVCIGFKKIKAGKE